MTAKDVACPTCAQQPSELCIEFVISSMPGHSYGTFVDFHASRIEAAAFINGVDNDKPVSIDAFNKAVEDSDLI